LTAARPKGRAAEVTRAVVLTLGLMILAVLAVAGAARASSTAPLFGGPSVIDQSGPYPGFPAVQLLGISCGTATSCVAVGGQVAQFTTNAGGAAPPTWSAPLSVTTNFLYGVSCPDGSLCVAAANGAVLRSTDGGQSWLPPVSLGAGVGAVTTVSCPDAGLCVAGTAGAVFVSTDGGQTWSGPDDTGSSLAFTSLSCLSSGVCVGIVSNQVVVSDDVRGAAPTWTPSRLSSPALSDVSCTENDVCVAVDTAGQAFITNDVASGSPSWSQSVIVGTASTVDGLIGLTSVSCVENAADAATDLCVAGDFRGSTVISGDVGGAAPASWVVVPTFDTGNVVASDAGQGLGILYPITCVGTGWCVAADRAGDATYGVVAAGDPAATAWSPEASIDGFDIMNAVSCAPTGQLCTATDTSGHVVTSTDGAADWGPPLPVLGPSVGQGVFGGARAAVSCVTTRCVAIAGTTFEVGLPGPSGMSWGASGSDPYAEDVTGVSCLDAGLCVAIDAQGASLISNDLGATWTGLATGVGTGLVSISCATTTLCGAVDTAGEVIVSRDAASASPSWSAPLMIDPNPTGKNALSAVSCGAPGLCVAVDGAGRATISTNGGAFWSKPAAIPGASGLVTVSCTATALCGAVDGAGRAYFTINPASASPTWTLSSSDTTPLTAISCAGTGLCVGVDATGDAVLGTSQVGKASVSGASGAFPDTVLGTSSASQTVTVTNSGDGPLNVATATLAGADAGQFAISSNTCGAAFVPPGASCAVGVNFSPAAPGAYAAADLVIASDSGSSPDTLALRGTAVLGPVLSLTGGPAAFPDTAVGSKSRNQVFAATNSGHAPLHISVAALTGADTGQFALSGANGCAGAVLAPGASCSVGVVFAPTSAGAHRANLELDSDAQPAQTEVALGGDAQVSPPAASPLSLLTLKAGKGGVITARLRLARAGSLSLRTTSTLPSSAPRTAKGAAAASRRAKTTRAKSTRIAYGRTVVAAIKGPTTATVRITPAKAAAAALRRDGKLRVVVSVAFSPTGAARRTATASVTVHGG